MASRIIEASLAKKAPLTWQQGCFEVISAEKVWRSELAEPIQDGARRIVGASGLHPGSRQHGALLQRLLRGNDDIARNSAGNAGAKPDSRLVKAVFTRIWAQSCIDRPPRSLSA